MWVRREPCASNHLAQRSATWILRPFMLLFTLKVKGRQQGEAA